MQSEWFEDFARAILKEKGVKAPDQAVEKQLVKEISEVTRDVVLRDLLNSLNNAELEHFEAAIDADDEAATQRVLADKQPIITESLQRIRLKYLGRA